MPPKYNTRPPRWLLQLCAAVITAQTLVHADVSTRPDSIWLDSDMKDECVALSNAMALRKLGFSVQGHNLVQRRRSNDLGREFEAAHKTFPESVAKRIVPRVLLNRPSNVNARLLSELTEKGALVLSLSTKRLNGDRTGSAVPDHAIHIRRIVSKHGIKYMEVENCWWNGKTALVPVSTLKELPYVYGLFLQKHDAPAVTRRTMKILNARPHRVYYASGRYYAQPQSKRQPPRNQQKRHEINRFMNNLVASQVTN